MPLFAGLTYNIKVGTASIKTFGVLLQVKLTVSVLGKFAGNVNKHFHNSALLFKGKLHPEICQICFY